MKHHNSALDSAIMGGFILIVASVAAAIVIQGTELFDVLLSLGMWVIVSFLIFVLVHGTISGIPKNKIRVPKGSAVLVFGASGILFFTAWLVYS